MKKTRLTKSFIAILSASAMMALSSTAAFAIDPNTSKNGEKTDVFENPVETGDPTFDKGTASEAGKGATSECTVLIKVADDDVVPDSPYDENAVYKVTVGWGELVFTYTGGTWDTTDHVYTGGTWDKTSADVTVTNDSNWGVTYSASFKDQSGATTMTTNGVIAALSGDYTNKALAAVVSGGDATTGTFAVGISGIPEADDDFELGTVQVVITPTPAT